MTDQVALPTVLSVWVPGRPAPQGSKKGFIGKKSGKVHMVEQSAKTLEPWQEHIRQALTDEYNHAVTKSGEAAVRVELGFVMFRPLSTPKRRTPMAIKKPDIDKLSRAVLDAVTSVGMWRDDSQVIELHARKRIAELDEESGCSILIETVEVPGAGQG